MKEGWEYKKLGEVVYYPTERIPSTNIDGSNYVGVDNLIKDRGGKETATIIPSEGNCIKYRAGDVLIGNIRPYLKKIWLADNNGGASGDVLVLRAKDEHSIFSDYLYWCLSNDSFFEFDMLHSKGAKMPRGSKVDIMKYVIPIPSISQQKQISSELNSLNGIIKKTKAQLEELDNLAQSIFYDMFGDPVINEKGWDFKKIGEIGSVERGAGISKKDFVEDGLPCIHYGQLHTFLGATTKKHKTCIPPNLLPKYKIAHPGDVIMAITSEDVEGSCTSTAWLGDYDIVVGSDAAIFHHSINGVYISYYTRTKAFYNEKAKYAKGFKVTHISTSEIESISIPLPPLSLQQEFASKIEAIESMKAKVRQSLLEAETLFNSRMDYYFN